MFTRPSACLALGVLALLPVVATASKPQAAVVGSWVGAPTSVSLELDTNLILRLDAIDNAPAVTAEVLSSPGVEVVGTAQWTGSLVRGQHIDLPVTVRFVAAGQSTLGARITIADANRTEVTGAVLYVVAVNGEATLAKDAPAMARAAAATSSDELRTFGIATELVSSSRAPGGPAVASTVTGTITYKDPEGHTHPVRLAFVQLTDASSGLLTNVTTSDSGTYSAAINAASVKVTAYSRDFDNVRALVTPLNQPTQRYIIESALTPITGPATTINLTSGATVRGTPGAPSNDSLSARGFATYDGMLTFWFQATAMIGRNMQQGVANFPESTVAGADCGTSCYVNAKQQMFILHDDAFDWDVLGHEFFHFVTARAAARVLTTSPGGPHSGASAIGENGRTRAQGMSLAWAEGLATAMSLIIQKGPPSTFPFPTGLANVSDDIYQDTEDSTRTIPMETPTHSDGYGSEESVQGFLWDLFDSAQDSDGAVSDTIAGVNATTLWSVLNTVLPCNPCDRVDRLWVSIVNLFGPTTSTPFEIAKLLVLNKMAPKVLAPAAGASVPGTAAPTFSWTDSGDPSPAHRSNQFILAFSRDNFQSHRALIVVPTLGATSYTPTDAEWASVQTGGQVGQTYKWFVAASRADAPVIPEGWFWYSNMSTIVPRSIEATITWSPLGADVDLHFANPGGQDIAYYNTATSWGFLDRDCISSCTQEIISVTNLPFRGQYRLFAHYFSDHGKGAATVHAVIRAGSQVLSDQTFVLGSTGATHDLITVAIPDQTPAPAAAPAADRVNAVLDPALLPPKKP